MNNYNNEKIEEYYEGIGCQCMARHQNDCACDNVDWTPKEVYVLRAKIKELEKENHTSKAWLATCLFRGVIDQDCLRYAKNLLAIRDIEQKIQGIEYHIERCKKENLSYSSTLLDTLEELYENHCNLKGEYHG